MFNKADGILAPLAIEQKKVGHAHGLHSSLKRFL